MIQTPLVTVLMPVYNAEPFLAEAIESILNQTFTDFEFLIINDGSTDNSLSIIESYNDKRIKLVNNETNIKLIATLNKGIEMAHGKYIARMDADDISRPERIEKQVKFMEEHPEVGLCGTFIHVFGTKNYDIRFGSWHEKIKFRLFFDTHFPHPTALIRTSVLKEHHLRFDPAYLHAEDFALWNVMADVTELKIIQEVLLNKRCHESQISNKYTDIQHLTSSKIRRELMQKMGYNANDNEISNYDKFLFKIYPSDKENLFILLDFFNHLIRANQNTKIYNKKLFEKYFADRYWDLCCFNTRYGLTLFKKFKQSQTAFILNLSLRTQVIFFLKTLLRYGK